MKASNLVMAVSILLNGALGFLLFHQQAQNAETLKQSEAARAEIEQLKASVADLQATKLNDADLERLKSDQREAIKLRGEVGNLKKAVADANAAARAATDRANAAARANANAAAAQAETPPNPYTRVFNTKGRAVMPPQHAMVVGGWEANPGRRTYAFIVPTTDPNNPGVVTLETKWVEVSNDALSKIDSNLLIPSGGTGLLTPEQFATALKSFEQAQGVDVLSSPKVTTASGRQASVTVTQRRNTPDGNAADFGPTMNLLPSVDPSDGSITVAVDATMTLPSAELLKSVEAEEKK